MTGLKDYLLKKHEFHPTTQTKNKVFRKKPLMKN